jgi:putative membrane protein (TIGR04086 family)
VAGVSTARGSDLRVDAQAVVRGAAVALAIAVPVQVLAVVLTDDDARSGWTPVLVLVIVGGLVAGAAVAARRQDRGTPLTHGIVTALGAYLSAQLVLSLAKLLRGDDVRWGRIVTNLTLSLVAGIAGGMIGAAARRRATTP